MSGKHYNRSVLCHKTMYEALQLLRFQEYLDTLDDESQEGIASLIVNIHIAFEEDDHRLLHEYINSEQMAELRDGYESFIAHSSSKSMTFAYWTMYIQMIGN